nr:aspartate aminotransferase family protein [Pseudomonas sp. BJa5]
MFDDAGRAYIDLYNNVPSVGHCHPDVVEAMYRQARELNTHTRYLHDSVLNYAERLLKTMPEELGHAMFTSSGSEANELALRIARDYTGGTGVIVTKYAYHGSTITLDGLSPSMGDRTAITPDARFVDAPRFNPEAPEKTGQLFAAQVREAFQDMRRNGIKPAALLVDTLFTSDGVFADPAGFLAEAAEVTREAGALFIADEVQAGFGRTGSHMWGFQRHGLVPDMVTLGKPMGNGYPMAGVAVKPHVVDRFGREASYFNTFAGNPVFSEVGLAVLDVIEEEHLMENAAEVGAVLIDGLRSLATQSPAIADVRGAGLYLGVETVDENGRPDGERARRLVNFLREEGALVGLAGAASNVLKIRPPLCLRADQAKSFIEMLRRSLNRG